MRIRLPQGSRSGSGQRRGGLRWWVILLFGGYLLWYWNAHQQESAFTGRSRLLDTSIEQEAALGVQAFRQILAESQVVRDGPLPGQVQEIARRLIAKAPNVEQAMAEASGAPADTPWDAFEWQVEVIDSPQANAFCLPGGKMAVYTGIVPVAENENALAAIMGHEIAHALLRHGAERMAHQKLVQIGSVAAGVAIGEMEPQTQRMVLAAIGAGTQYGVLLPFSRDHETEADYVGLMLAASACYDPREAPRLWERMARAAGGKSQPEFMSTHPGHDTRIRNLESWMPEAVAYYQKHCPGN